MGVRANLVPKKKRRAFPFWSIFMVVGLVNLGIFLLVFTTQDNDQGIPLPEAQCRILGGSIAFDGETFWATAMLITFGAKTDQDIVQFDNEGKVINVFTPEQDFCGLAFDGERLWTADAVGSGLYIMTGGKFFTVDMGSGRLVEQFTINRQYMVDGIAASEYQLWVIGRYRDREGQVFLWEIDQYSKSIAHEITLPAADFLSCSGITYFKDYIYAVVGIDRKQVLKISTYEGRIVERFDFTGREIYGITHDRNDVLVADGKAKRLFSLITEE
jgi:hypothetical protein